VTYFVCIGGASILISTALAFLRPAEHRTLDDVVDDLENLREGCDLSAVDK
jgi:hypothetical protein